MCNYVTQLNEHGKQYQVKILVFMYIYESNISVQPVQILIKTDYTLVLAPFKDIIAHNTCIKFLQMYDKLQSINSNVAFY